jgi:hypothetical protein
MKNAKREQEMSKSPMTTPSEREAESSRRPWVKPEVKRITAGSAENGLVNNQPDASFSSS